jgi:hypothetical protein
MYIFFISKSTSIKSEATFIQKVIHSAIGIEAILFFYINIVTLSLLWEIPLQMIVFIFVMLNVFSSQKKEYNPVKKLTDMVLAIIGISLIVYSTYTLINAPNYLVKAFHPFVLSIVLPILIIPFIYVFSVYAYYESLFDRIKRLQQYNPLKHSVKLAIIFSLRFRTLYISEFTGKWIIDLFTLTSFSSSMSYMSKFRQDVRIRYSAEKIRIAKLKKYIDNDGVDKNGIRLDRREFNATKIILNDLYYLEMGQNRNKHHHYIENAVDDNLTLLRYSKTAKELPDEHGIHLIISNDKMKYYAWRQTISGWCFGIGGTENIDDKWHFEGDSSPKSFPCGADKRWIIVSENFDSLEWSVDDSPKFNN